RFAAQRPYTQPSSVLELFRREFPYAAENSYEEFINWLLEFEVRGEGGTQVNTYQILTGNWLRAWLAFARGDDQEALGRIALADRVHREWKKKMQGFLADGDLKAAQRLGTVNLAVIKKQALEDALARLAAKPALKKRLEERAAPLIDKKEDDK
ncbi:MAG: hypothetical protein ACAI25_04000, partial [Planctomycetota bacterium]